MKKILLLITIIPIITIAQSNNSSSLKLPLIESITSDTVQGKFNQVLFSYDQTNRVVAITKKEITISADSKNADIPIEQITEKQEFEYDGMASDPFSRKLVSYELDKKSKKWNETLIEQQYYLYKNGKRVRDSIFSIDLATQVMKLKNIDTLDLNRIHLDKPNFNIRYDNGFEANFGHFGGDYTRYEFLDYDSSINPLKQLNISNSLALEKISLTNDGLNGETAYSWYFLNQNNVLNLISTTEDFDSSFDETYSINYFYNQFNQPIQAKLSVVQEIRRMDIPYKKYQKSFTFRYK